MKSSEQIGAPVRVEKSDPALVKAVAKAKSIDAGEVREISRLDGLIINEREAHKALKRASDLMETARLAYFQALESYADAVSERKAEERK